MIDSGRPYTGAPCVERRTCGAAQMGRGGFAAEKRMGAGKHPSWRGEKRALRAQG